MVLSRYLQWPTCSIILILYVRLTSNCLPNIITLVFKIFTVVWFFLLKSSSPFSCFWAPLGVVETIMRSSSHNRLSSIVSEMVMSDRQTPVHSSKQSRRSDIYSRNIDGLALPSWFTPTVCRIGGLWLPLCLTRKAVLLYRSRRVSITLPCRPDLMIL